MRRSTLLAAFILMMTAVSIFAGTTGKIAGRVVDKSSGNSLPGANIVIENSILGAASDLEGEYTILHVPPGTYSLKASMMGYTTVSVTQVGVRIDQTTRVDFELMETTIAGEEITIIAEKDIIREDVATSVVAITAGEVEELPLSNLNQVVELQAGIEDGLVIRGGGADESLFQLDGITLRDPRNNKPIANVPLSAIQEISIERGGFNAEYGQVRSGIINVVTKEGSKTGYFGSFIFKAGPPAAKNFDLSPYDRNSMWLRPYLDPAVAWTGTENGAWDEYERRQYPKFDGWNVISDRLMQDSDATNDLSPAAAQQLFLWERRRRPITDKFDYNIDAGFGGPVPLVSQTLGNLRFFTSYREQRDMLLIPLSRDDYLDRDFTIQLTSDIKPSMKLRITGLTGKSYNVAINATDNTYNGPSFGISGTPYWSPTDYVRTPFEIAKITAEQRPGRIFCNSWYSTADVGYRSFAAKLTHTLNPKTFYETSIEYIGRSYLTGPIAARDTTRRYEIVTDYFVDEAPFGWSSTPEAGITGMFFGGHTSTSRDSTRISSATIKFDLTSQVNFNNLLKTGFEFVYNDLNFDYGLVNEFFGDFNYVKMRKFPFRGAFYVQDKLETKGFILNVGLRLDYSNPNSNWVMTEAFDKSFYSSKYNPDMQYHQEKATSNISLSPRLAISHPITANSKLFFNYGHFKQMPTYEEIFRIGRGAAGEMRNYGDPNLILAKTISYELGYDHVLFTNFLIQLAAFYHDIIDQQAYTLYTAADGSFSYYKANNNSYEDIRGFELTLKKSIGQWWTAFANYTYQVNTAGHFGKQQIYENPSEQKKYDLNTRNLYQERPIPRPYARANLVFHTPDKFGPEWFGIHPFDSWALNFLFFWRSGEYITWNENSILSVAQNAQVRDWHNMILGINKSFKYGKMKITLFAEINNVFNTRLLSGAGFYDANDWKFYMSSLHLPESAAYNNIVGNDKVGDYRKPGVDFQPIEQQGNVNDLLPDYINPRVIYYEKQSGRYMHYLNDQWQQVPADRLDQINKNKAYIDMPNQTSFNFLNPRQIFFGIRTTFDLN